MDRKTNVYCNKEKGLSAPGLLKISELSFSPEASNH